MLVVGPCVGAGLYLNQAPNPANAVSRFWFETPVTTRVTVTLSDLNGRTVARLADGAHRPGRYPVVVDVRGLPAGLYFVRMQSPEVDYRRGLRLL